jgi:Zn-dependent M28 family amino/carboxypeptidase
VAAQDHLTARRIPTKKQIQDISVMLDFDMLASPNYGRFIYDGNGDEHGFAGPNGSGNIEQLFKDFWSSQGLAYETIPFDGRSDYDAFTTAGIPAGGIFAGAEVKKTPDQVQLYGGEAGAPFDVCYHQLCDRLTNINDRVCPSTPMPRFTRSSPSRRLNPR